MILYQAYGKRYIDQAIFSIVSLINIYNGKLPNLSIYIYTDQPAAFNLFVPFYPVEAILISEDERAEWAGVNKFILRTKIIAPLQVLNKENINLLFVDTDTFFTKKIDKLFSNIEKGYLLMHIKEQSLSYLRKRWHSEFKPPHLTRENESGLYFRIEDKSIMWNAGVIGIQSNKKQLLLDVLVFNDYLYPKSPHWLIEQLSYSAVFNATGKLRGCNKYIFHYYPYKEIVQAYLNTVLHQKMDIFKLSQQIKNDNLYRKILFKFHFDKVYFGLKHSLKSTFNYR